MIEEIRHKVQNELFELSVHALTRSVQRHILLNEIVEAVLSGTIIESYPQDHYGPSCLLLGYTLNSRPFTRSMQLPIPTNSESNNCLRTDTRPMGTESDNQEMMNWPDEMLIETQVRYILDLNNRLFVFENVPARVNPVTGEQFFAPATVRRIQQIARSENVPKRTIEANVYDWVNAA